MEYSGKTTNSREGIGDPGPAAIKQVTVFDVQWSDCPIEVEEEVKKLWRYYEYGNDHYIHKWETSADNEEGQWPIIAEYLASKNVTECWIYWWW